LGREPEQPGNPNSRPVLRRNLHEKSAPQAHSPVLFFTA
jgi:hypothetical protein